MKMKMTMLREMQYFVIEVDCKGKLRKMMIMKLKKMMRMRMIIKKPILAKTKTSYTCSTF